MTPEPKVALQKTVEEFFENIEKFIIQYMKHSMTTDSLSSYERLVKYCTENPRLVFKAIDCLYPMLDKKDTTVCHFSQYLQTLKNEFITDIEISYYLNNYSSYILILLQDENILDKVVGILEILLIDLHKYHNLGNTQGKDLQQLVREEYLYRNKKKH